MNRWLPVSIVLGVLAPALANAEATKDDFYLKDTQDLVDLCTTPESAPLNDAAVHFCHGFVSGAWQYHQAQANGPDGHRLVCLPEPAPTRDEAIAAFVTWSKANPQHLTEPAVEALFRFLAGRYPCPSAAAAKEDSK